MLLNEKINNNVVLPFDMKMRCSMTIYDLLSAKVKVTDRLRANFNKQLDGVAKELTKFISTAFRGDEYVEPADDTTNIANAENYLPQNSTFVFGRQFLTNNDDGINANTMLQHQNNYSWSASLWLLRLINGNSAWTFSSWTPINFWMFATGQYTA